MSSHTNPPLDPVQLPLPGLDIQEPLKRGGFADAEFDPDPQLESVISLLRKQVTLLENIVESLDDLTTRVNDLDDGGYRGR